MNFPLHISKSRSIKGFGENISQLSLCINVSHLYVSLLNMVSQKVVSPLKVSHSFVKDWFLATKMALVFSHMRGTLSKLTPKCLMVCTIHRIWEQQLHTQPLWWIRQLKIVFEKTSKQEKIQGNDKC
jgi:hypothetical protein